MKKLITLSLILVTLIGCSAQNNKDGDNDFTILKKETYGGKKIKGNVTITSQEQLAKLYTELNFEEVPTIDFSKKNVVALFLGQKNTGGFTITVGSVEVKNNTATVRVLETTPNGGMATMALSAPYCIASIPKTDKVIFQ